MRLFTLECKKLLTLRALWVFVLLCLALNAVLFLNPQQDYQMGVAQAARSFGTTLTDGYADRLAQALPTSVLTDAITQAIRDTSDTYAGYDTGDMANYFIQTYKLEGFDAEQMRRKYPFLYTYHL